MVTFTEKEIVEDGITYIIREYSTGSVVKWQKQSEELQEPQQKPVTNEDIDQKLTDTQNLLLDTMSGTAEMYELLSETQNLQLDTMSGIADMYELAMTKEERTYMNLVAYGRKTIDEVPEKFREAVLSLLKKEKNMDGYGKQLSTEKEGADNA